MEVQAIEGIDRSGVEAWFAANAPGTRLPLEFERISGGRSNLTYGVEDAAGNRWALRRPPLGKTLASAHDMGREYRILCRLCDIYPPAPRPLLFCDDESVLGAPFYVMERRRGVIYRRGPMPLPDPAHVRRLCLALIDNLARLGYRLAPSGSEDMMALLE